MTTRILIILCFLVPAQPLWASCHPIQETVLRLNKASTSDMHEPPLANVCITMPTGWVDKVSDQATWVLLHYSRGDTHVALECESGDEYLINNFQWGSMCPLDFQLDRQRAVRDQLLKQK